MRETFEAFVGLAAAFWLTSIPVVFTFIWFGAGLVKTGKKYFSRVLSATLAASSLTYGGAFLFLFIPGWSAAVGFALGSAFAFLAIKALLKISAVGTTVPWFMHVLGQGVSLLLGTPSLVGSLPDLLSIL